MKLPQLSIARPVTVVMFYTAIVLLGIISLSRLPQELFPPITYPQLTVVTIYPNAAPEEVENQVSKAIEEGVGTVSGLNRVLSKSKEGLSLVMAQFGWNQNMDLASLSLREKVDLIKARIPSEASEPIVMKFNPFELPVLRLSVTSEELDLYRLKKMCKKFIKDNLEKINGVASANISGGIDREILVEVDQDKIEAIGLNIVDISEKISQANVNYPGGTIKESFFEYLIRTLSEYQTVEEIANLPVHIDAKKYPHVRFSDDHDHRSDEQKERDKKLVYLKDVATIQDTLQERKSFSRYNGLDNISISIQKQAGANTLEVVKNVKAALKSLTKDLPGSINIDVAYDQSIFIKQSINGVKDSALQGGILVFIVLFTFLKSFKSSIIVTFSIPISVMFAFTMMYFGNLSLNMMSLGGLALGVGMLVDNAVVVIENIFRHEQLGKNPKKAATEGAAEVSAAIFSSTLTTIAVFLPIIFVIGMAGQLFKQLSLTITYSLVASLIVAMSLIPLLASKGKRKKIEQMTQEELDKKDIEQGMKANAFTRFLRLALRFKWVTLGGVTLIFILSMRLFGIVEKELMPRVDQGQFVLKLQMPSGTKVEVTNRVVKKIEDVLMNIGSIKRMSTTVGSSASGSEIALETLGANQGQIIVDIEKKSSDRKATSNYINVLKPRIDRIDLESGTLEYILQESAIKAAAASDAPVVVDVTGIELHTMRKLVKQVKRGLKKIDGIYGITDSAISPSPEIKIFVDKEKATFYGLSVKDVGVTAKIGIRGFITTSYHEGDEDVPVMIRLNKEASSSFDDVRRLAVHSSKGFSVPLKEVGFFGQGKGPTEIARTNQQRIISVYANVLNRSVGEVLEEVQVLLDNIEAPEDYRVTIGGNTEERKASFDSLRFALILSIILVYMIMASQFESFWQPFIIMFTLPLSLIGVAWALVISGTSLNIIVLLGVIMLGGIVVNNGIILIDYINNLRDRHIDLLNAVVIASKTRLRPILMTALTTVLGLLPMALAFGEGSELRAPMAVAVMGGLIVSTFLTLVVIPTVYILVAQFIERFSGRGKAI